MNRNSKEQTKQNGCKVFPDRTSCRNCQFSSDPDLFDGCCLYGKVTARKVVAYDSDGNPLILDSVTDMAEQLGIATQIAYNIIRRKQVFRGMTFRYMDSAENNQTEREVNEHDKDY